MVAAGYATALAAHLPAIVFQGNGEPLPPDFEVYPTFIAHSVIGLVLASLIVLHILAALYHQLVLKDGLIRRMLIGRGRTAP